MLNGMKNKWKKYETVHLPSPPSPPSAIISRLLQGCYITTFFPNNKLNYSVIFCVFINLKKIDFLKGQLFIYYFCPILCGFPKYVKKLRAKSAESFLALK